jgi:hypothetical protein
MKNKGLYVVLRDGGEYLITEEQINWWKGLYTDLDVEGELLYLKMAWENNTLPRKTAKNINKYINKFLYEAGNLDN